MNAMERCAEHRLLRCAVCMHRQTKSAPTPAATSAAPGEILDGPMLPTEAAFSVDKQAQEAIERNREIAEKTAVLPLSAEEVVSEIKEDAKYVIPMRAIRQIAGHPEPVNPVIYAAAEYTEAQKRVETAAQTIKRIRIELDAAENEQKEAIEDRNVKKSVLQKLVAE